MKNNSKATDLSSHTCNLVDDTCTICGSHYDNLLAGSKVEWVSFEPSDLANAEPLRELAHPAPISTDKDVLDEILVDLVEEHFPKGISKERGQAMVVLAGFLRWHESKIKEAVLQELNNLPRTENDRGYVYINENDIQNRIDTLRRGE